MTLLSLLLHNQVDLYLIFRQIYALQHNDTTNKGTALKQYKQTNKKLHPPDQPTNKLSPPTPQTTETATYNFGLIMFT